MANNEQLTEATQLVLDSAEEICALVDRSFQSGNPSIPTIALREALLDMRASYMTYLYVRDNPETDS